MRLKSTDCLANVVRELKRTSSRWCSTECNVCHFQRQSGFAAFTVSAGVRNVVVNYIANQVEHHKQFSSRDELRARLIEAGLEIDERYFE